MEKFSGQRIGVLGLGKSGQAAARFLRRQGAKVFASDSKSCAELGEIPDCLGMEGIAVEYGGHTWEFLEGCEYFVVSPGIPANAPFILEAIRRKVPIISEIELAYRVSPAPIVAVTGTNGKSTTVSLIGHLLNSLGKKAVVVGNIGTPLLDLIEEVTGEHIVVMEVSSFQLETIELFRPKVASFLNITPDHLNRHATVDDYFSAKLRLFKNQSFDDFAVLNHDDMLVRKCAAQIKSKIFWFSRTSIVSPGCYLAGDVIVINGDFGIRPVGQRNAFPCIGNHNTDNLLAAISVLLALEIPMDGLSEALAVFCGLSHRLELVETVEGISFYDDSKGTNPDATVQALHSFESPIILIAGGSDKGLDLKPIALAGRNRVKSLVAIGETGQKLLDFFDYLSKENCFKCASLTDAVFKARSIAVSGDVVLLSPGCASFDMFKNAEDRGEQFQLLVRNLKVEDPAAFGGAAAGGGRVKAMS